MPTPLPAIPVIPGRPQLCEALLEGLARMLHAALGPVPQGCQIPIPLAPACQPIKMLSSIILPKNSGYFESNIL